MEWGAYAVGGTEGGGARRSIMRRTFITLFSHLVSAAALSGCATTHTRPDPHSMAPTTTERRIEGRTTLNMPIPIPGQSTVIVPFAIESEKDWYQTRDPYSAGGMTRSSVYAISAAPAASPSYTLNNSLGLTTTLSEGNFADQIRWSSSGSSVRWHNAILRDMSSGEEWSILDKRAVISSWSWFGSQPRAGAPFVAKFLLFIATLEDTNHDGVLNDLDARVAIITDPAGRHPRIVSPPNAQVWSTAYDSENNKLYLLVIADTNGDGKFDYNDSPVPYSCDPTSGAAAPVISDPMLRRVEGMLK